MQSFSVLKCTKSKLYEMFTSICYSLLAVAVQLLFAFTGSGTALLKWGKGFNILPQRATGLFMPIHVVPVVMGLIF